MEGLLVACSVDDCSRPLYSSGMCSVHYNRKRTTGTTDPGPQARGSAEARFWRYVQKGPASACWEWQGKSKVRGYGVLSLGGRGAGKMLAHRFAYTLMVGPIPEGGGPHGTVVMHTCDNRLCCNPAHLRLGTQADNVADMNRKRRGKVPALKGSAHPRARFTEDDIRRIRASDKSNVELGRKYGCARQVIGNIRRRTTWKHVE